ncbi:MAG: L-threonylcarbamoyladenylate synthase [Saprospiraceae bacterium]
MRLDVKMNTAEDILGAIEILKRGGVILYPTDTIWGLGCDILSEEGVEKIYRIKRRDRSSPLILLVSSIEMLKEYVPVIHPRLENLLAFHEKPVTVIYDRVVQLPSYLKSKDGSIGIRITREPYSQALIESLTRPITSTSANISGHPFPKYFGEVQSDILQQVDYISQCGRESREEREPSVVMKIDVNGELDFVRY